MLSMGWENANKVRLQRERLLHMLIRAMDDPRSDTSYSSSQVAQDECKKYCTVDMDMEVSQAM